MEHVSGVHRGQVTLYALSTCGWCRKTRALLDSLGIDYHFTYVDQLSGTERAEAEREMARWNPRLSFPTIVIDNNRCINGFDEDRIVDELGDK